MLLQLLLMYAMQPRYRQEEKERGQGQDRRQGQERLRKGIGDETRHRGMDMDMNGDRIGYELRNTQLQQLLTGFCASTCWEKFDS
jgi:hypothetical protein